MKCEVQRCKAEAKHTLRMPKVRVCEVHYLRNKKALRRLERARSYFKQICGEYHLGMGIHYGIYRIRDNRRKRDKVVLNTTAK